MQQFEELENYSCTHCTRFIAFDGVVLHNKKPYHRDCYTCSNCDKRLHLTEKPIVRKGKLLCSECAQTTKKKFPTFNIISRTGKTMNSSSKRSSSGRNYSGGFRKATFLSETSEVLDHITETPSTVVSRSLSHTFDFSSIEKRIRTIRGVMLNNQMAQTLTDDLLLVFSHMPQVKQKRFVKCIQNGILDPHAPIGALAMAVEDYTDFALFFDALIKSINRMHPQAILQANVKKLRFHYQKPLVHTYDLSTIPKFTHSVIKGCQMQFFRNLTCFPLVGSMSKEARFEFEEHILPVLSMLVKSEYGGSIVKLGREEQDEEQECFISNMSLEGYIAYRKNLNPFAVERMMCKLSSSVEATPISSNFPLGSGVYISRSSEFRIYYNHEDHLCFEYHIPRAFKFLSKQYTNIVNFMNKFEECYFEVHKNTAHFLISERVGHITSCPSKLGGSFTPSVFMRLPELLELDGIRSLCKKLDITCTQSFENGRGTDLFQICPKPALNNTEEMTLDKLFKVIPKVLIEEKFSEAI